MSVYLKEPTYGAYGNGTGTNAGYSGVGKMWGNFIGNYRLSIAEFNNVSTNWLPEEDWFNPGFLKDVEGMSDFYSSEVYGCLSSSTNTFAKMVSSIKTNTDMDAQVDTHFDYYHD